RPGTGLSLVFPSVTASAIAPPTTTAPPSTAPQNQPRCTKRRRRGGAGAASGGRSWSVAVALPSRSDFTGDGAGAAAGLRACGSAAGGEVRGASVDTLTVGARRSARSSATSLRILGRHGSSLAACARYSSYSASALAESPDFR